MNTLAALCLASGINLNEAAETELARVWTKVEKIRAKQAAKPKHSPLPEAATPAQGGDAGERERTIEECAQIAFAIDSGRGNERVIGHSIRALKSSPAARPSPSPTVSPAVEALRVSKDDTDALRSLNNMMGFGRTFEAVARIIAALDGKGAAAADGARDGVTVPEELTEEMRYATWKSQALHVGATELEAIKMANQRMTPTQREMDQAAYSAMLAAAPPIPRHDRVTPQPITDGEIK